ncbi:MAG: MFS transporter [Candidatus Thermoplasmatota archaeon]|nr:MFS transporter [Candidatus Thermoplasmatota archaeon]
MVLDDLKRFPRVFRVLVASALIENMAFGLIIPFLAIYIIEDLGLEPWTAGVVLAGYMIAGVPSMIFGGMLADKIGRRPVLLASLGLMSLTMLMYFFAYDFVTLLILVMADSFVGSMYMPAANAMIADVIKSVDRPRAFSALRVAWNVGTIFGPVMGMVLVVIYPIKVLFVFGALILAAAFFLNLVYIRETRPEKLESMRITFRSVMSVARDRPFLLLCSLSAIFWFFFAQWMSVLPVYARTELGVSLVEWALTFTLSAVMIVSLQLWVTSQVVRFRRSLVLAVGQLIAALGFGLIFLATDLNSLIGCIVVITIGEILYMSILSAIIADMAPEVKRGMYMGFSGLVQQLGAGLGFLFGMTLYGLLVDTSVIWLIIATIGAVTIVGYFVFARIAGPSIDNPTPSSKGSAEKVH